MKAAVYDHYGPPDVIRIAEVAKEAPKDDEVLLEVRAASINPVDWHFVRGTPYLGRLMMGLRKPRSPRLGVDVAGRVEAVGPNVTRFKPGDEVFGSGRGVFAESVCVSQSTLAAKPANATFDEAATVAVSALTALQGLRDKGHLQPGQTVLINGAAGGVGTYAVQIAKAFGGEVTGVCSTRNVGLVRSLGAARVIDYTVEDFTKSGQRYDLIFDCIGNRSVSAFRRLLTPRGTYLMVGGESGRWVDPMPRALGALVVSRFVSQKLFMYIAKENAADLATMRELIESGKVRPVIDRRYPLSRVAEALAYLEDGHARGKVVITLEDSQ